MTEELDNKPLPSGEDPQAAPPKPLPAPEGISEEHPAACSGGKRRGYGLRSGSPGPGGGSRRSRSGTD